jgi:SAM-dependent methyltransferase
MAPPDPAQARILEIGCATGHHLLPLSMRWPQASLTGIDASAQAVASARDLATAAGLDGRTEFHACPLEEFTAANQGYDIIIAHGFFSWVPDAVKRRLLSFCAQHLSPAGLAVVSFNVEAGWRARMELVRMTRAVRILNDAPDEITALQILKSTLQSTNDAALPLAIIDDMLAKGPEVLAFDDFAPVNDPWRLDSFVAAAAAAGLRWIGESCVADNRPPGWTADDEARAVVIRGGMTPVAFHQWMDEQAGRTFRSALLCRADAPPPASMKASAVFGFALRPASPELPRGPASARRIHQALMADWPSAPLAEVLTDRLPDIPPHDLARTICGMLIDGSLWARSEPLAIPVQLPSRPALDPLRMACARRRLPVVDAWHRPCSFPAHQLQVLESIDGSFTLDDLRARTTEISPRLDFDRWLNHIHQRGLLLAPLKSPHP